MPRLPETFSVWYGELPTQASVRSKYGVQVSCLTWADTEPIEEVTGFTYSCLKSQALVHRH